ncbi:MAG: response regulator, partial [Acidobacteriota bacterium]|nr:response regulator [Acidobacteriota bacterium]
NAIQAMPDGGVVRITGREVGEIPELSRPGRYVAIAVRDEGGGISEHDLSRIFDPYFSTKKGGSGLGLATSYSIVRRHEGLLTVDSRPGLGSTFTIYLPATGEEIAPGRPKPTERFDGTRVLVMDDDDSVRDAVRWMLESLGCVVTATSDGREAVARYIEASNHRRGFDVVILDLTVPAGMGGEETIRELRRIDPDVRAIVASGYANAPVIAHATEYGFRAVLSKPFDRDDIIDAFRQALPVSEGVTDGV